MMDAPLTENFSVPGQNQHLVAIACVSAVPESCTFFTAQLLGCLVEEQFRRDDIQAVTAPICGSSWVLVVSLVPDLNPALRCLFKTSELLTPPGQYPLREIAFFDSAEGYWRTVFPMPANAPFSRFFDDEVFRDSKEKCLDHTRFLKMIVRCAKAKHDDSGVG